MRNRPTHEPYLWDSTIHAATGRAFDWICPLCDADVLGGPMHMGHVAPFDERVGIVPGNIVFMCPSCNASQSNRHLLDRIGEDRGALARDTVAAKLKWLHDTYFDPAKVRQKSAGVRTNRVIIYMNNEDRARADLLLKILASRDVSEVFDRRGKTSLAGMIRYLVQQALEEHKATPKTLGG